VSGILNITNGDSAAERLRAADIEGDILVWRDVLHEGPVPGRLGFAQLREVRARFIGDRGWATYDDALEGFTARDAMLDASGGRDEVVLWFEHDLYDQLQLIQILHRLDTQGPDPGRLTLACEADYLGMMSVDRVRALHARRANINRQQVHLASAAWVAFTAPEAARVTALLENDTTALPFLGPALRRHLEEFPSTRTGLSRSEQQALEVIAAGAGTIAAAFPQAHHQREEPVFLGDVVFAWYLERMSQVREPLVLFDDGTTVAAPKQGDDRRAFWDRAVRITAVGGRVLAGDENAVALNGIDRWLGGVHLEVQPGRPALPAF
jgi:hypothetical protein